MSFLSDFPPGPLDYYRNKASFDWKKLKLFFEGEEIAKLQDDLYKILLQQPEFQPELTTLPLEEERRKARRQLFLLKQLPQLDVAVYDRHRTPAALTVVQAVAESAVILAGAEGLFRNTIKNNGTERHKKFLEDEIQGKISGSFALTEVGHGTNTKGMQTIATYNKEKQAFILHSPSFEAAKCWSGGLGHMATHCLVFAQLYVNGIHRGLHGFIVPIRDPKTLLTYPGLIVGDMGEKIGLNGIDNGFLLFDNYSIPLENHLNKYGDVTPEGEYISRSQGPAQISRASFAALSNGRIVITGYCAKQGMKALTIAIRYAAVRKQFGPPGGEEIPILEYQTHQYRLLPYLAAVYVIQNGYNTLNEAFGNLTINDKLTDDEAFILGAELHALSSASKSVSSWIFRDAIQESREACGGHGYLKAAGIWDAKVNEEASLTYEGDSNVLIQQTSNWLVKLWPLVQAKQKIEAPLDSVSFLTNGLDILNRKFSAKTVEELCQPQTIIDAFQWLFVYLLKETAEKLEHLKASGLNNFEARNQSQVFLARNLSITFIQHFFLQRMLVTINLATDLAIRNVLLRLFSLYGIWNLEKHLSSLYRGGYASGTLPGTLINEGCLQLCADLKDDAVSLVDALAPPDIILNSVLGASDGQVYKRLQAAFYRNPYSFSRPNWWHEVINSTDKIKTKL